MSKQFSEAYPSTEIPTMPEYFKPATIESIIPGDIVYPFASSALHYHESNRTILIDTSHKLNQSETDVEYSMKNHTAVTRVYQESNGQLVDGYIADLRHVEPGNLSAAFGSTYPEDADDTEKEEVDTKLAKLGHITLLAAVFSDPDNNPHFMGAEELKDQAADLIKAVDAKVQSIANTEEANKLTDEDTSREELTLQRLALEAIDD